MYRIVQNNTVVGTVSDAARIDARIGELYKAGVITTLIGVALHPDDVSNAASEIQQMRIDEELVNVGLTAREQRVVTANGTLLALMGISRLMVHNSRPDDSENNIGMAEWLVTADKFINMYTSPDLLLNVLDEASVVDKILTYAINTGSTINKVKTLSAEENIKETNNES